MKILGWIIALPVIAFALFASARFLLCGPDKEVVKVATPMVQGIADYIVKHGVPESLADIDGLPYELEGCNRKVRYRKMKGVNYKDIDSKRNAEFAIINESCKFSNRGHRFNIWFWFSDQYEFPRRSYGRIKAKSKKTSVGIHFKMDGTNKLKHDQIGVSFDKRFGFCRQFKQ